MIRTRVVCAIAVVISVISPTAYAANTWNVNATSCIADSATIRDNLYLGTGGTIKFAPGKTGAIVLYCPVPFNLDFVPSSLGLTYRDDVDLIENHVAVQYVKMNVKTGAITTIVNTDSNFGAMSTNADANHTAQKFVDIYDPVHFVYYLRINLFRELPAADEIVYNVSLSHVAPPPPHKQ